MAKLSDELIIRIFNLQRLLLQGIDEAKAAEFEILARHGENQETEDVLLQIDNATERLRNPYNRFCVLLLRIAEEQPNISYAMLELLEQSIIQTQATLDGVKATTTEIQKDWNL